MVFILGFLDGTLISTVLGPVYKTSFLKCSTVNGTFHFVMLSFVMSLILGDNKNNSHWDKVTGASIVHL